MFIIAKIEGTVKEVTGPVKEVNNIKIANLHSTHALLIYANSGETLLSKNSQQKMYPASLIKILTLLVAIETIDDHVPAEIFPKLHAQKAAMA